MDKSVKWLYIEALVCKYVFTVERNENVVDVTATLPGIRQNKKAPYWWRLEPQGVTK